MSDTVRCLAWMPNRPGQRCGLPIVDSDLLKCARHSLEERRRLRLRDRESYGGHEVLRHQETPDQVDAYYHVAEHAQVPGAARARTPAAVFGEIDACNIERLPHCNLPAIPSRPEDVPWEHFRLSRNDWSHT